MAEIKFRTTIERTDFKMVISGQRDSKTFASGDYEVTPTATNTKSVGRWTVFPGEEGITIISDDKLSAEAFSVLERIYYLVLKI